MEIKAITLKNGHSINTQCKELQSFLDILNSLEINTEVAAHFIDEDGIYNVNIIQLYFESNMISDTWEGFEDNITVSQMLLYKSDIRMEGTIKTINGNITEYILSDEDLYTDKRIRMVTTERVSSITIKRGSIKTPGDINNDLLNLKNNDLCISIDAIDARILSLENSLCVINGKIFYSLMYEGKMWVTQCVQALVQTSGDGFFIDFTNLGGRTLYTFAELNYTITDNVSFEKHSCTGTIKLTLPDDVNMEGKTPLLVIEGRMFFPHEFIYTNKYVSFDLTKIPLEAMLIADYGKSIETTKTSAINTGFVLKDIIEKKWSDPRYEGSFLVLVNSNLLINERPLYNTFITNVLFDNTFVNQSLLIKNSTRDLVNYVQEEYNSRYALLIKQPKEQMLMSRDNITLTTYGRHDPRLGLNLKDSYYTVLNIKKR